MSIRSASAAFSSPHANALHALLEAGRAFTFTHSSPDGRTSVVSMPLAVANAGWILWHWTVRVCTPPLPVVASVPHAVVHAFQGADCHT